MATNSILKNVTIIDKKLGRSFVTALEKAENRIDKDIKLSRTVSDIKGEKIKEIFDSEKWQYIFNSDVEIFITKSRCPPHLRQRVPLDFFGGSTFLPPKTLNNGALRLIELNQDVPRILGGGFHLIFSAGVPFFHRKRWITALCALLKLRFMMLQSNSENPE